MLIHETFQETVQGEGHWVGLPVDFIRLAGCPVGCHFCDTGYANGNQVKGYQQNIPSLLSELKSLNVVISGGEPFANKQIPELVDALLNDNRNVFIETSGSFWQEIDDRVWITLSPKQPDAAMTSTIHTLRAEIRKYKKMEQEATNLWTKRGIIFND